MKSTGATRFIQGRASSVVGKHPLHMHAQMDGGFR
jgi:hypothetical protein